MITSLARLASADRRRTLSSAPENCWWPSSVASRVTDGLAVSSDGMMWRPKAPTTDGSKRRAATATETAPQAPRPLRRDGRRDRAARQRFEGLI
jgi:hypothetical protein